MRYKKIFPALFLLAAGLWLASASVVAADNVQRRQKMTLNEPTEIPGTVLQPGTYVIKVMDYKDGKEIVQFTSEDEKDVIATVLAIRDRRVNTKDAQTGFVYFPRVEGNPIALKSWYYAGDEWGEVFAYPHSKAVAIARATHEEVVATPVESNPTLQSDVAVVKPEEVSKPASEPTESAAVKPQETAKPAPESAASEEPAAPVAEKTPARLPKTGSDLPLFGLIGLAALAGAAALHLTRRMA
jgi:LPXTG-motif cell wall-anchored protein